MKRTFALSVLAVTLGALCVMARSFEVGEKDFLLDGKPFVVRCGEVHYARIPRAYWRHRLQMLRAMGCNAVGCYMFWNFHEREKGVFTWDGRADVAAFCRMAQAEGLWVILRPGPYSCAEWEGGGAPWWLMGEGEWGTGNGEWKKPISMRSSDPRWVVPATNWLHAVGRVLIGASRKRIVKKLTGEKVKGKDVAGNLAIAVWSAVSGASVVRVHDVRETAQSLRVTAISDR